MTDPKHIPALRFNWLTGLYDSMVGLTMPECRFKTALLNQANIQPFNHVLDFGVGTATLSLLAKQMYPKAYVTGVDVDEKVLAIAKRKLERADADITLQHYDGKTLPFSDSSFDRIISSLVFHHLLPEQKLACLKELHRVLKEGGELHIADWGKAANIIMRLLFYPVQILDGFQNTADNVSGCLPSFIEQAGLGEIMITKSYNTLFGTLSLISAKKKT